MSTAMLGKPVLIRTYSAGVHFGTLTEWDGAKVATLQQSRRIWSWTGANTLNEIANVGVKKGSKISLAVQAITLTETIEIIQMSDKAVKNLGEIKW